MKKEIKIEVKKISNGFLFTETCSESQEKLTFKESKSNVFDLLKDNEEYIEFIENEDDYLLVEVALHNVSQKTPEPDINSLREKVVVKEVYNPVKTKDIDLNELRLSVTKNNCYSAERLASIDFKALDQQLPMSFVKRAEIAGAKSQTIYSMYSRILKNTATFQTTQSRIYMTVLAKYYEMVLQIRSSKKDELERVTDGIRDEIKNLDALFLRNTHIHTNNLAPIIFALKQLIHEEDQE
jgi:hypothetical protein